MSIRDFSHKLQTLYQEMADIFSNHQAATGLTCLTGCGRCCTNPDIEASILEMIPFALKIFDQGQLEQWLEKLSTNEQQHCLLLEADRCTSYEQRPSICRMFGVWGHLNKHQQVTLSVCKSIKEDKTELLAETITKASLENTPMLSYWSTQLGDLDPQLIQERMPINQAIYGALEKIALYAQYQSIEQVKLTE